MSGTRVGGGGGRVIRGEARVTYLRPKYAVLSKPGLDGGIFLVPSSIMGQQKGYPDMATLLAINDIVKFEAVPQEEKNGIKWTALDATVSVHKKAEEVEWKGSGVISFLDERTGQFGFLDTDRGSVWFNANVVRPEAKDVTRAFKKGQTVAFIAVENHSTKNQCKYRATLVHSKNYKKPERRTPAAAIAAASSPSRRSDPWPPSAAAAANPATRDRPRRRARSHSTSSCPVQVSSPVPPTFSLHPSRRPPSPRQHPATSRLLPPSRGTWGWAWGWERRICCRRWAQCTGMATGLTTGTERRERQGSRRRRWRATVISWTFCSASRIVCSAFSPTWTVQSVDPLLFYKRRRP